MATLATFETSFDALPFLKGIFKEKQSVKAKKALLTHESAAFNHALVALAAKLAAVDGTANQAEFHAFIALFCGNDVAEAARRRTLFVKHLYDRSTILQYARQIAAATKGDSALHRELLQRLLQVASADAMLNAAEIELLRAVSDVLGLERETFRELVGRHLVPATSPYAVLGVSAHATDDEIRTRYMAKVQQLHPDRYQAAGASDETVSLLSDQLAALNSAYQMVRTRRAAKTMFGRKTTKGAKAVAA
jgi:DnaJ like chaperone protein